MLEIQYLLDTIHKCFKYVPRDIAEMAKMRLSLHSRRDDFLEKFKKKIYDNFVYNFPECEIYVDELPSVENDQYIAISLADSDSMQNGSEFFGAVILYRNMEYKLSMLYLPLTSDKILLRNGRIYSYDVEGRAFNIMPKKRTGKILATNNYNVSLQKIVSDLDIPENQVFILGSKIYSLFWLFKNKVDIICFKVQDPILQVFLDHFAENLSYQDTGGLLALKSRSKYINYQDDETCVISFSSLQPEKEQRLLNNKVKDYLK